MLLSLWASQRRKQKIQEVTASGWEVVHQWCVRCHLNCVSRLAPLLYDVSSHCLCFFSQHKMCITLPHSDITHTEWASPWILSSPSSIPPTAHEADCSRISRLGEWYSVCWDISVTQAPSTEWSYCGNRCTVPSPTSLRTHPSATAIAYTRGATADTKYMQLAAASYCGVWPRDRGHRCQGVERWRKKEMFWQ